MTSLMTVELHQRLQAVIGRPLLPTLLFDYPTIESVSNYLARELSLPTQDEALTFTNVVTGKNPLKKRDDEQGDRQQQIQRLSEEAATALLEDELAGLEEDIRHI